jgi:alpha-beta hydrolase superfamily lysophospholipase
MSTTARTAGIALAYHRLAGNAPVVVFCPGYNSDMTGTKAVHLEALCAARGQAFLRFDYSGHGASGGAFADGSIGDWAADAAHVISVAAAGQDIVLVGSSMGGWISLLLAPCLGARLRGLVLVAPAPDFTELLIRPALTPQALAELAANGVIHRPSDYGPPVPLTAKLLQDGARHQVLGGPIAITAPVRILHGMVDEAVPYALSLRLVEHLASHDVQLTLIKDGEHRLSRPAELAMLGAAVAGLLGQDGG